MIGCIIQTMKKNYINRPENAICKNCKFMYSTNQYYVFGRSICSKGLKSTPKTSKEWGKISLTRDISETGSCDEFQNKSHKVYLLIVDC